ncbi:hypothetical protein ACSS6W_002793 [Trichoderma asperelloides]
MSHIHATRRVRKEAPRLESIWIDYVERSAEPVPGSPKHSISAKVFIHQRAEPMDRVASSTPSSPTTQLAFGVTSRKPSVALLRSGIDCTLTGIGAQNGPTSSHEPGFGGPKHFVWPRRWLPIAGRGSFNLLSAAAKASRRDQS